MHEQENNNEFPLHQRVKARTTILGMTGRDFVKGGRILFVKGGMGVSPHLFTHLLAAGARRVFAIAIPSGVSILNLIEFERGFKR